MNNIENIVKQDFCICCGSCESICPRKAISSVYNDGMFHPQVKSDLCVDCGLCLKVCPSHEVNVQKTYSQMDMGNIEYPSYIVYSLDNQTRKQGTSGGVISTMIIALLEAKYYDKAYVLDYEKFEGAKAVLLPTMDRIGVLKAAKSKYIPASVERVIEDIKNNTIGKSIIVATPCQLLAIKRCLQLLKISENELLFLGLFCDKTEKYSIYKHFEDKYGTYQVLHFRDKEISGWPGNVLLKQNGVSIDIPREERMLVKEQFQMNRCRYCFDKLNMLADISFGDCYLDELSSDKLGYSNIVLRTEKGLSIFDIVKGKFKVMPIKFNKIKQSQYLQLKYDNLINNINKPSIYNNIPLEYLKNNSLTSTTKSNKYMRLISVLKKINRVVKRIFKGRTHSSVIFIDNIGFINKGAELMLHSIVEQIRLRKPQAQIVVHRHVFNESRSFCVQNNIFPLQQNRRGIKKIRLNIAVDFLLNKPWIVTPDKVDVIIDAAGLHISDHYIKPDMSHICGKQKYVDYLSNYYSQFSKPTCKLILLPQMFGPYGNQASIEAINYMYNRSTLIYAREQISYNYLQSVLPSMDKIRQCPDFTCILHPIDNPSPIRLPNQSYVLVVPNCRMLDKTEKEISNKYMEFMHSLVEELIRKGENVYLLNHEGVEDEIILHELNKRLSRKLPILTNLTGIQIKEIILHSKLLISSRYHGVVSGLTQGIPTFCTSWSHKYQELLLEHQCSDNQLNILEVEKAISILNDALRNPNKYTSKQACILSIENQIHIMWEEVFKVI